MRSALALGLLLVSAHAAEIHLSPTGKDANPGTPEQPVATLVRARDLARAARVQAPDEPIQIILAGGEYHLTEPLVLTPEDSGTVKAPLIWRSAPGQRAMLRAAREITGWQPWRDGILVADLRTQGLSGVRFHQLFRKGDGEFSTRLPLARYPNVDPEQPLYGGFLYVAETAKQSRQELIYREGDLPLDQWPDRSQAELVTIYNRGWMFAITPIRDIDPTTRTLRFDPIRGTVIQLNRYFVQNALGALDAPGEWYLDYQTDKLYLKPPAEGIGRILAPVADQIVELQGQIPCPHQYLNTSWHRPKEECLLPADAPAPTPVRHVYFYRLDFEGARQDALRFLGTENCGVNACRIANVGNVGVNIGGVTTSFAEVGNPRVEPVTGAPIGAGGGGQILLARDPGFDCLVMGCDIWSVGAEGIMLMGERNVAENNHVYDTGLFAKDAPCINLLGDGNMARRNTLHDCPRCAVFLKGVNNVVEGNDCHHMNMETTDMGGIRMVQRNPHLKGNVIRYNRITDSVGYGFPGDRAQYYQSPFFTWGVYLDDYTCGTTVHGNLISRCGRGGIMVHGGGDNTVTNNVCVDAGDFQIELAPIKRDYYDVKNVFAGNRIERNLLVCHGQDAVPYRYSSATPDTASFRHNLVDFGDRPPVVVTDRFQTVEGWDAWLALGQDQDSVVAPAKATLSETDELTIKGSSPVWKLGFEPIPIAIVGCYAHQNRASWPLEPNHDRKREAPILAVLPGVTPPPTPRQPYQVTGPIRIDFEDPPVGQPLRQGDTMAPPPSAIVVSQDHAASGKQSLQFVDAPGLKQDWIPRIYFPLAFSTGKVQLAFDLYLPAGSPVQLYVDPRQYTDRGDREYLSGPMLTVQADGNLQAGGKTLATLPRDTWCHLDLTLELGQPTAASQFVLTLGDAAPQTLAVPHVAADFQRLERVVISSTATEASSFYLDNLTIAPIE